MLDDVYRYAVSVCAHLASPASGHLERVICVCLLFLDLADFIHVAVCEPITNDLTSDCDRQVSIIVSSKPDLEPPLCLARDDPCETIRLPRAMMIGPYVFAPATTFAYNRKILL